MRSNKKRKKGKPIFLSVEASGMEVVREEAVEFPGLLTSQVSALCLS